MKTPAAPKYPILNFRCPKPFVGKVKRAAKSEDKSVGKFIRDVLKQHISKATAETAQ